jgi:ATP-dependent RNA helicase RhlE
MNTTDTIPSFRELGLTDRLVRALEAVGHEQPTLIQAQAIPPALEGRDVLGCARTGTGKTAAFVLPILQRLAAEPTKPSRAPRALVVAPTRELASQIAERIAAYGARSGLRHAVVFGGVSQGRQVDALKRGVDILVATPGRLEDLMNQGHVRLDAVEVFVLDEFDRMLDQGFLPAIRRIARATPRERQTLLFSATSPAELAPICERLLVDPIHVAVTEQASTPELVEQSVWFVEQAGKRSLLERLLDDPEVSRAVVFTRTKHGASRVARQLATAGVSADAIHGNRTQNQRDRTLARFKAGAVRVLVATDVAARGLDVDEVSHVINYDLPADPESYVHRIGRTARAGRAGTALSLCSRDERDVLGRIERLIACRIPVAGTEASQGERGASSRPAGPGKGQSRTRSGGPPPRRRRGPAFRSGAHRATA